MPDILEKLLVIDTETTGLNPTMNDLLSVGMVEIEILGPGRAVVGISKEVLIRSPEYVVSPKALEINGINLVEHHAKALSQEDAETEIINFLEMLGFGPENKVVCVGHNVAFDIGFLQNFLGYQTWNKYFGHRHIDTTSVAKALYHAGIVGQDVSRSADLFERFSPGTTTLPLHTALGDSLRTAYAYVAMIKLLGGMEQ
jgi:DNA polymerase III epsilon subunit-like protein